MTTRICDRRRALGISQGHLADVIGIHRITASRAENTGRMAPDTARRADTYLSIMEAAHAAALLALAHA